MSYDSTGPKPEPYLINGVDGRTDFPCELGLAMGREDKLKALLRAWLEGKVLDPAPFDLILATKEALK